MNVTLSRRTFVSIVGAILGACGRLEAHALTRTEFESLGETVPDWSNFHPSASSDQYGTAV